MSASSELATIFSVDKKVPRPSTFQQDLDGRLVRSKCEVLSIAIKRYYSGARLQFTFMLQNHLIYVDT